VIWNRSACIKDADTVVTCDANVRKQIGTSGKGPRVERDLAEKVQLRLNEDQDPARITTEAHTVMSGSRRALKPTEALNRDRPGRFTASH